MPAASSLSGPSSSLITVLRQAEAARDSAHARLLQAEESAARARAQHGQLLAYRDDYRARAPGMAGRAASIDMLRCHQGFMQRLEQALLQQLDRCRHGERDVQSARAELLAAETHLASVKKLTERRAADARRGAARYEQRAADDAAQHRRGPAVFAEGETPR